MHLVKNYYSHPYIDMLKPSKNTFQYASVTTNKTHITLWYLVWFPKVVEQHLKPTTIRKVLTEYMSMLSYKGRKIDLPQFLSSCRWDCASLLVYFEECKSKHNLTLDETKHNTIARYMYTKYYMHITPVSRNIQKQPAGKRGTKTGCVFTEKKKNVQGVIFHKISFACLHMDWV